MDYFDDKDNNLYHQFQDTMDQLMYQYQQNPKQYQTQPYLMKPGKMQTKPLGFYHNKPHNQREILPSKKGKGKKKGHSMVKKLKNHIADYNTQVKTKPSSTKVKNY